MGFRWTEDISHMIIHWIHRYSMVKCVCVCVCVSVTVCTISTQSLLTICSLWHKNIFHLNWAKINLITDGNVIEMWNDRDATMPWIKEPKSIVYECICSHEIIQSELIEAKIVSDSSVFNVQSSWYIPTRIITEMSQFRKRVTNFIHPHTIQWINLSNSINNDYKSNGLISTKLPKEWWT